MIVPMKKILLLALADEIESVLADLRDVGVVDIVRRDVKPSATATSVESAVSRLSGILSKLKTRTAERGIVQAASGMDAGAVADGAEKAYAELAELRTAISRDTMRLEELSIWGEFSRSSLARLAASGLRVTLCVGSEADFKRAEALDGVCVQKLEQAKRGQVRFVVIGSSPLPTDVNLPIFKLSDNDDPATLRAKVEKMISDADELERRLDGFAATCASLERLLRQLSSELEFCRARDSFERHRDIIVLEGFVPEPALDTLRAASAEHGWGLSIDDPNEDDEVPVLVRKNRFSKLIDPLFDFLGILPGYRELDVSGAVMVFFTVFYAMIIGDFGYGLLFLAASAVASILLKGRPAAKVPIRLSWILGIATVAWGALCGNFFGTSL
ncbi:MAG: hypothetical protein MJ025_00890, partial [Victivallaceae bacterium]|nr:hypothetical protein [Victivallaceae bacterium]